jgi:hypothetical protein
MRQAYALTKENTRTTELNEMELPESLSEMVELVPDSLHLVKAGANGFPALVSKAKKNQGHNHTGDPFAVLKSRRDDTSLPLSERQHAGMELIKAQMIVAERVRQRQGTPFGFVKLLDDGR